jgi:hypothetical protein
MLNHEPAEQTIDTIDITIIDDVAVDAKPACVALVPLVQTAQWAHRRQLPPPSSIFVTQLIATGSEEPQNSPQATAIDANAAYTAIRHRLAFAGIRARQTV